MSLLLRALALFSLLAATAWGQATGAWDTPHGRMTLTQNGNRVQGRYPTDNGAIVGTMNGSVLEGFWIEDHSARACSRPAADGRVYWGRVRFWFQGATFRGAWGYCEDPVSGDGTWNGARVGPAPVAPAPAPQAPAAAPGSQKNYWTLVRSENTIPTRQQLGPDCRIDTADASDRGMRLAYTCLDGQRRPNSYAANVDYTFQLPALMTPNSAISAQGRLIAQSSSWSASCSVGPASLFWLQAEAGVKPSAVASGKTDVHAPWCGPDGCPELTITCALSNSYDIQRRWIYRWVR